MTPDQKQIHLPVHNGSPECWERIVLRLQEEEILNTSLSTLPTHNAPDSWPVIEASITTRRRIHIWTLRTAAVVVIGLAVWIISRSYRETQTKTVSVEIASADFEFDHTDVSTNAIKLIRNASAQTEGLSTNPAFREMITDLEQLEHEQLELEKEIERNGVAPELIRAKVELENRRAQTTKNLIRLIML